jgi:hypothetical protein
MIQMFRSRCGTRGKMRSIKEMQQKIFSSLKLNKNSYTCGRSPSSLPHLIIGMEIEFLAHFYSRNYENEIEKWQGATFTLGYYI